MSLTRCVHLFAAAALAASAFGATSALAQTEGAPSVLPASAPSPEPASAPPRPAAAERALLSGGVAALVNDDVISIYDLRQRTLLLILTSGVPPTQENLPQIQSEALRSLVDEHLQLQELRRMEKQQKFQVVADDQEVDQSLAELAKDNNATVEQMRSQFARAGLDLQTLKDQLRVQISWNRMITGLYSNRVRVGDRQISMALQRIKETAGKPQYQLSEIFIDAGHAGGITEAMNGANQLIGQIQQGAPFAPVARQFSSAPNAANGGDMGWVSASELPAELAAAVEQMRPGQLSQPIAVNDGVYIVQLRDKRSAGGGVSVSLKQAAVRLAQDSPADQLEAARKTLESMRATGATCGDLESKAANVSGVIAGDLGQSEIGDLSPEFRAAAQTLPVGQFSEPIRTPVGLHLIMVCERKAADTKLPSRQEIENRLHGEQLAMLSRRYLRDLRNSATIETP